MMQIDDQGMIISTEIQTYRVEQQRMSMIERAALQTIRGLVAHQPNSSDAASTLEGYTRMPSTPQGLKRPNGAHFLITREGRIVQTASLFTQTQHVGALRSRALLELSCSQRMKKQLSAEATHKAEKQKDVPQRYTDNTDSVGIEMVGLCRLPEVVDIARLDCFELAELRGLLKVKELPAQLIVNTLDFVQANDRDKKAKLLNIVGVYDVITGAQQGALSFLIEELMDTFNISPTEVQRHPAVSYKNSTEAQSAHITTWH